MASLDENKALVRLVWDMFLYEHKRSDWLKASPQTTRRRLS